MENTVKVYILGAAAVIVSAVKLEDWKLAEKFAPEKLKKLDDNGEPVFRVMTGAGTGSMNRYGVKWGNFPTEDGNATVTILFDEEVDDKKQALMDVAGSAILELTELENAMPGILESIHERARQMESHFSQA